MKVVWLVNNLVPYHVARFAQFSKDFKGESYLVQVTDKDEFEVLQVDSSVGEFNLHTLYPGTDRKAICSKELKKTVYEYFDILKPDCVCVSGWGMEIGLISQSWALKNKIPTVMFSVSTEIDEQRVWYKEYIKKNLVKSVSSYFCGGLAQKAYLEILGADKELITTGHNVVDTTHFQSSGPNKRDVDDYGSYYVACTRFGKKKNIFSLIESYSKYSELCKSRCIEPYKLIIAGDGELRPKIEMLIEDLDVRSHVLLLGAVSYKRLPMWYQNAKAFVHVSTSEQWGLVVNEAMAAGAPVIVSERCGCSLDLVKVNQNGFTVNPFSNEDIATKLLEFHELPQAKKDEFSNKSREIISNWTPKRFSSGLSNAVEIASSLEPKGHSIFTRFLFLLLFTKKW
ncbi:glycosyltransferase family 4 protein [Vibrio diabolicus]|uniref:Glycosyltransferase family 4 protein n=1 Tax=Vibrio diabolicus TaxID=50719 RepID=A0AA92LQD7_9VIBR|nr:glycosyltransferase family 4 protein [Vibrio diabolicus]QRG82647.1 glycosyltransferase family 4 protein [Vibrio diabolicus]